MKLPQVVLAFWILMDAAMAIYAAPPSALAIMKKVDALDQGDNRVANLRMILVDGRQNKRIREIRLFSKKKGRDTLSLMFFLAPADVKNSGLLTFDYDDAGKEDDQWLYLPALRQVKRIAGSDKSGSFMGTDFTYSDMSQRDILDFDFTLQKETQWGAYKLWQIGAQPKNAKVLAETGYSKSILFVRQDNYVIVRAVHWVEKGKKLKYMEVKKLENIAGIWVPTVMQMTVKKGKKLLHETLIEQSDVKFNQNLADSFFSQRQLEKGL